MKNESPEKFLKPNDIGRKVGQFELRCLDFDFNCMQQVQASIKVAKSGVCGGTNFKYFLIKKQFGAFPIFAKLVKSF